MADKNPKGGKKGGKKYGRNRKYCEAYRRNNLKERHKIAKLRKYLKTHPNDKQAAVRIEQLRALLGT